jgi:hypothetical protein
LWFDGKVSRAGWTCFVDRLVSRRDVINGRGICGRIVVG